jgi:hypothetical protein
VKGWLENCRLIQYEACGYEYGKSVKGLIKWHKGFDKKPLNRKILKQLIRKRVANGDLFFVCPCSEQEVSANPERVPLSGASNPHPSTYSIS